MESRFLNILFYFLSSMTAVCASDSLTLQYIQPAAVKAYDVEEGLMVSCIEESFFDPKGRLYVPTRTTLIGTSVSSRWKSPAQSARELVAGTVYSLLVRRL